MQNESFKIYLKDFTNNINKSVQFPQYTSIAQPRNCRKVSDSLGQDRNHKIFAFCTILWGLLLTFNNNFYSFDLIIEP